jgi:hypothetical protein
MIKKILLVLALVIALVLVLAAFQPSEFRVTRSTVLAAAPSGVFAEINNLRRWQAWSPWENLDPAMKRAFTGAESGVGAVYAWEGNSQVGSGKMTITESRPAEWVRIRLEFIKPMEAQSTTEFTLRPEGNGTALTWTMYGTNNYFAKIMCLFMSMDKMLGANF